MKKSNQRKPPKRVLRLPDLDFAKRSVLNSLGSPASKRAYEFGIDDFVTWYCSEPRLAFSKPVVLRYRLELEARRLAPATINLRLAPCADWRMRPPTPVCSARNWRRASGGSREPSGLGYGSETG